MNTDIHKTLAGFVGQANSFPLTDPRAAVYIDKFGFVAGLQPDFVAVARPDSTESLLKIVALLNHERLGMLYSPNGAGNGARLIGRDKPLVIVDTQRMNKILDVSSQYAYALIEPGVTYKQLLAHFDTEKLPMWVDADRNADNSIVGSVISKQYGYTPYHDHLLMQCGAELVLPNGELLRTGMGGIPGSQTWQLYKYSFGPYLDGIAMQSDLAIISKLGLWIMGAPPKYMPFMVALPRRESAAEAVDVLRPLLISGTIPSSVRMVPIEAPVGSPSVTADGWHVFAALYGLPDMVGDTWKIVEEMLGRVNGARVLEADEREGYPLWHEFDALFGGNVLPSGAQTQRAVRLTFASSPEGEHVLAMQKQTHSVLERHGIGSRQELVQMSRSCLLHVDMPRDSKDIGERQRLAIVAREMIADMTKSGFYLVNQSFEFDVLAEGAMPRKGFHDLAARVRTAIS